MREHGVTEIRTADADFHQFPFLEVVNPLAKGRRDRLMLPGQMVALTTAERFGEEIKTT